MLIARMITDHDAFVRATGADFADTVADDLSQDSGVPAKIGTETTPQLESINTVEHEAPKKISDDDKQKMIKVDEDMVRELGVEEKVVDRLDRIGLR
jgi:hypothetical protein